MSKKKKQQAAPFAVRSEHDGFSVSPASVAEKPETGWQHFRKHFFDINDNDHLSGYEIFFIFVVSAILGALIEQIFCVITNGYWERRTSLVYGEFGYACFTAIPRPSSGASSLKVPLSVPSPSIS